MKIIRVVFLITSIMMSGAFAQTDSSAFGNVEIFLIDSYITPEKPHRIIISFFTSDSTTSSITFDEKFNFIVSKELNDNHKIEINLSEIDPADSVIKYRITTADKAGDKSLSQIYELELPQEVIINGNENTGMIQVCCFGGVIFGLPSPTYVVSEGKNYFSLAKEIPLFSFYSMGYNYPVGYFGIEYAHIFEAERKNYLRVGYKHIFQPGHIKYISPGINFFSDFLGFNGVSAEISFGLFQIQNVFTFYTRYRHNFKLSKIGSDFEEFSIGLYSNFFSINF